MSYNMVIEHPDYLIIGLGNPGLRFKDTRRNIGYRFVNHMYGHCIATHGMKPNVQYGLTNAISDLCVFQGCTVAFALPQVPMNNVGMVVKDLMDYYDLSIGKIIVFCDDVSLPFGSFKFRSESANSEHNGIKSIIEHTNRKTFIRARLGVGPCNDENINDYLLSDMTKEDTLQANVMFDNLMHTMEIFFESGKEMAFRYASSIFPPTKR